MLLLSLNPPHCLILLLIIIGIKAKRGGGQYKGNGPVDKQ